MRARYRAWLHCVSVVLAASGGCDGESGPSGGPTTEPVAAEPVAPALTGPFACAVSLTGLDSYQAVRVPLVTDGATMADRNAPVISGRRTLFRAQVAFSGTAGNAQARLIVESAGARQIFFDTKQIAVISDVGTLESTFNFDVPGAAIGDDARVSVDLRLGPGCPAAVGRRLPETGSVALGARTVGALKVMLIPVQYDADSSGRLPDVSDEQLALYRDTLMAIYPVSSVDIRVRETVVTTLKLGQDDSWSKLLDQLREVRDGDAAAGDIYYYGLVSPGATFAKYCRGACTAGLSYLASDRRSALLQTGVGVGFTGQTAADTLAHELGHQHGRKHAPCQVQGASLDDAYPYERASIGSWGFDQRNGRLQNPMATRDLMSYCGPAWISDYNFSALAVRRESVVVTSARQIPADADRLPSRRHRVLLLDGQGGAIWGRPFGRDDLTGDIESARVLDKTGQQITRIDVRRISHADSQTATILVPEALPGWASIEIQGTRPLAFAAADLIGMTHATPGYNQAPKRPN